MPEENNTLVLPPPDTAPVPVQLKPTIPVFPIVLIGFSFILISIGVFLLRSSFSVGLSAAQSSYVAAKEQAAESARQTAYEQSFQRAEKQYHVSNRMQLHLESLKQTAVLEVLSVQEEEIITERPIVRTEKGIYSWVKFRGIGTFTVNLQSAEYIADDAHNYLLVRLPSPNLDHIALDTDCQQLFYKDKSLAFTVPILQTKLSFFDGSNKDGVELMSQQKADAYQTIEKSIRSNPQYFESAKKSAVIHIQNLLHSFLEEDVQIEIQFF